MAAEPVLVVDRVTKVYGDVIALEDVNIQVRSGTVHGLVGPNGAGKTTLLSIVFGLVRPNWGTVSILGGSTSHRGPGWLDGVAGFLEAPTFYPYLSGRRNLELLASLDGQRGRSAATEVQRALVRVGLEPVAADRVRGYSLGMRQRLGLASALLRRPKLLILDEPTNGLDPTAARDLREIVRSMALGGASVVFSSHNMAELEQVCHSVTVLRAGRIAFDGTLAELRASAPEVACRLRTNDDDRAAAFCARARLGVEYLGTDGLRIHGRQDQVDEAVITMARDGFVVRELVADESPLQALYFDLTERSETKLPA